MILVAVTRVQNEFFSCNLQLQVVVVVHRYESCFHLDAYLA